MHHRGSQQIASRHEKCTHPLGSHLHGAETSSDRARTRMNLLTELFTSKPKQKPVRFAVVGLGHFAQTAILPAFANATDKAALAALVTGDPDKARELSRRYQVPATSYDDFDRLLTSGDIDAVYIAVPNSEHRK